MEDVNPDEAAFQKHKADFKRMFLNDFPQEEQDFQRKAKALSNEIDLSSTD